jgi:hypothetical protein
MALCEMGTLSLLPILCFLTRVPVGEHIVSLIYFFDVFTSDLQFSSSVLKDMNIVLYCSPLYLS